MSVKVLYSDTILIFSFLKRMISNQWFDSLFSPLAIDSVRLLVQVLWGNVILNLKEMSSYTSNSPTQLHCLMPQLALSINDDFRCWLHLPHCWLYLPVGSHCGCSGPSTDATWAKMRQRSTVSTASWQKTNQSSIVAQLGHWFAIGSQSCHT